MLYFAYGSNMSWPRLRQRTPLARPVGPAWLPGYRLVCNKTGRDGSGKGNLVAAASARAWGRLYRLSPQERTVLDRIEGLGQGYEVQWLTVVDRQGTRHQALTYLALITDDRLLPFDWYKTHLVIGAREAGLPPAYRFVLDNLVSCEDPDRQRYRREMAVY